MAMTATTIQQCKVESLADGKVTMSGSLSCSTEVAKTDAKLGSRMAAEDASRVIEAIDGW